MMEIICKGGVEYLKVNVFGDSKFLNPHLINISQIRYIREYTETKDDRKAWGILVGRKLFPTYADLKGFARAIPGDIVKIGSQEFECAHASSLSEKIEGLFFFNHKHILYMRKFVENSENGKSDHKKSSSDPDKIAIITADDRIIPANIVFQNKAEHVQ